MTTKVIEYKSAQKTVTQSNNVLDTVDKDGIVCSWTGTPRAGYYENRFGYYVYPINFTWNFDWTKLKAQGVDSISGHINVTPVAYTPPYFTAQKIDINWTNGKETITRNLTSRYTPVIAHFRFYLTAHNAEIKEIGKICYDEMFAASDLNDTILVVEEKKLHVNKGFLSTHSDFFRTLFSSNFKEGKMAEIPIEEVSYEDFGRLMSVIYPNNVFPNDKTAEKLLELADRFLMPFITHLVEHHLLEHSKLANEKLMMMADVYSMPVLLEKCIRSMDTVEKMKNLERSPEYEKMSDGVKVQMFERILQFV